MDNEDKHIRTEEFIVYDLAIIKNRSKWKRYYKVIANAMSSIPWVGPIISAQKEFSGDPEQNEVNDLYQEWLKVHKHKIEELMNSLDEVTERLETVPDQLENRINSEEYLSLVRRAFKSWDNAETKEKKEYIVNLISNSASTNMCPDDLVRLFNDWLDQYHEIHFKVIRAIYQNNGITRLGIWQSVSSIIPREDSAEADLFKLLIRDLSTGGVIRQYRETNYHGEFVKKAPAKGNFKGSSSSTMESAFENSKPYQLTELGSQFVHYTMNQVVKRIGSA
ncbi:hypothetical protein SAMN05216603_1036 [Pseudomonas benzenivorans]|nr:hypothetical protein [Pseudomonas benzenivorans]SDG67766.1 hypothetical protein SAMN05216603_1036 [Pseudomonas benzenivorans]